LTYSGRCKKKSSGPRDAKNPYAGKKEGKKNKIHHEGTNKSTSNALKRTVRT